MTMTFGKQGTPKALPRDAFSGLLWAVIVDVFRISFFNIICFACETFGPARWSRGDLTKAPYPAARITGGPTHGET